MTASTVWISYDLGVRGDYEGLYAWLDAHDAKVTFNERAFVGVCAARRIELWSR